MHNKPSRIRLFGLPFDVVTMKQTLDCIASMIQSGRSHRIATANVDFTVCARRDLEMRQILHQSDLVVCDGMPLVWASKWLRKPLPERVAGSDLVPQLLEQAEQNGWRVYFLGGQPQVTATALHNIQKKHPLLQIAGSECPPFQPLDEMDHDGICQRIRSSQADLLFVSFGSPKQEKWIARNYAQSGAAVSIGVGATIDFLAGSMKRAPHLLQIAGAEWLFRLAQEPKRLFKRYAHDALGFLSGLAREIFTPLPTTALPLSPQQPPLRLAWQGPVTLADCEDLWQGGITALQNAIDRNTALHVDLSGVSRIDQRGIDLMLRLKQQARHRRARLAFVNPNVALFSRIQSPSLEDQLLAA